MTRQVLVLVSLLAATGAAAQDSASRRPALQDCSVVEAAGTGGGEVTSIGLAFSGDGPDRHVVAAAPRASQAPAPETEMRSVRPGVSTGATLTGQPAEASFTMATVEAAGTVLLETWRWRASGAGQAPGYVWSRLRCGP
jgi:hypothetical protein